MGDLWENEHIVHGVLNNTITSTDRKDRSL